MPRIKIELPETFIYQTEIRVRITDLNYGNHLGHDTLISLMHEARSSFLLQWKQTELEFYGVGLILTGLAVEYKSEVFYGDTLIFELTPCDFAARGFDFAYKISNSANGKEVARAVCNLLCFDYKTRKVATVPAQALVDWGLS